MPQKILVSKVEDFNDEYKVSLNLDRFEATEKKNTVFEEFPFDKKDANYEKKSAYYKLLTQTLLKSLSEETKISERADYNLSDFNLYSFLQRFEDIADHRNKDSKTPSKREAYEGINFKDLLDNLKKVTKGFNKPLYGIWADKIISKEISYSDLQNVTKESMRTIERLKEDGKNEIDKGQIANVLYAHEAMSQVWKSRKVTWIIGNFIQAYREYKYLQSLKKATDTYIAREYPVAEILNTTQMEMMKKAYENTDWSYKSKVLQENEKNAKEKFEKEQARRREISAVAEKMKSVIDNNATKDKITNEIAKKLPSCIWNTKTQTNILNISITKNLMQQAQKANETFDELVSSGRNKQEQMVDYVRSVFEKSFSLTQTLGYNEVKDQLVVAQIMTDVVLKNISPVALDPELSEFANGYALNNSRKFESVAQMDGIENAFNNAKKEYDDLNRENIKIEGFDDNDKKVVVQPIDNSGKQKESQVNIKNG